MWKFIIGMVLLIYVLSKVNGLLSRVMGQSKQAPPDFRRPADGRVHMDSAPKKGNRKGGLKGGEYVDYEEIK